MTHWIKSLMLEFDYTKNKKEVVDHNYDQEKESANRRKIKDENYVFDLEEDSEEL
ncbi:hypothetical protein [Helicobacter typhlonius]|uniref:hypothetical protein n=1 Tax=Helicobacter typhlonius TaxID=76936 RepID=UPI002FE14348